jgi:hypothetical protein
MAEICALLTTPIAPATNESWCAVIVGGNHTGVLNNCCELGRNISIYGSDLTPKCFAYCNVTTVARQEECLLQQLANKSVFRCHDIRARTGGAKEMTIGRGTMVMTVAVGLVAIVAAGL